MITLKYSKNTNHISRLTRVCDVLFFWPLAVILLFLAFGVSTVTIISPFYIQEQIAAFLEPWLGIRCHILSIKICRCHLHHSSVSATRRMSYVIKNRILLTRPKYTAVGGDAGKHSHFAPWYYWEERRDCYIYLYKYSRRKGQVGADQCTTHRFLHIPTYG